jgi:hypothetical protein
MPKAPSALALIRKDIQDLKLSIQQEGPPPKTVESAVKTRRRPGYRDLKLWGNSGGLQITRSMGFDSDTIERKSTYDLVEVIKLLDIEPYFAVSVDRHVELIMKKGYEFRSQSPEVAAWVRRRVREIEMMSEQPFDDIITELAHNLVTTSNAFMVFYRDEERSSGRWTKMWGKERAPIASVSIPDPSSVRIKQTKSGRPSGYVQRVGEQERQWSHHDVMHITMRKKSGDIWGTPFVIPALEDIRALRKLEMVGEHVCHKYAFPLMHWRVGSEKVPAGKVMINGVPVAEVDVADEYASKLAQEGYIVTSERHEVKLIGLDGQPVDIAPFIDHYELRVIAGLRLSLMDLGRGDTANRGTATVLSQILVDSCTQMQQRLASFLTYRLLDQLVMEGGYDLTDETRVQMVFPPIDSEELRAHQNHGMQLYVQGLITRAEARREYLNRDELTPEEEANLYLNEHLIPLAKAEAKAKAVTAAKTGTTDAGVSNLAQPENQHGKAATAPRLPANDGEIRAAWFRCSQAVVSLADRKVSKDVRTAFTQAARRISALVEDEAIRQWREGVEVAKAELKNGDLEVSDLHQVRSLLLSFRQKDLQQLNSTCMVQANIEPKTGLPRVDFVSGSVVPAFSSTGVLLDTKVGKVVRAARILGYLQAHKAAGTQEMNFPEGSLQLKSMNDEAIASCSLAPRLQASALHKTFVSNGDEA